MPILLVLNSVIILIIFSAHLFFKLRKKKRCVLALNFYYAHVQFNLISIKHLTADLQSVILVVLYHADFCLVFVRSVLCHKILSLFISFYLLTAARRAHTWPCNY